MSGPAGDRHVDVPPFEVPPLRFAVDALEPAIGRASLHSHHELVHRGYADAINRLLAPYGRFADASIEDVLRDPDAIPVAIRDAVLDLGGAHANHQFLWKVIGPPGNGEPHGALAHALRRDFGDAAGFRSAFERAALGLDGPGFAFLSLAAPKTDRLEVLALPGNGSVLSRAKPGILVCDLWEHAWAADHADRAAWLEAFWTLVDWDVCERRYLALRDGRRPE